MKSKEKGEKKEVFEGADSNVRIDVNFQYASIGEDAPVIRVAPHEFTSEEVQAYTQVFFKGQEAYENTLSLSKSEIEAKILEIKQYIGDEERLAENYNNNEDDIEEAKQFWQKNIEFYENMYATASDIAQPTPTDWIFKPSSFYRDFASAFQGTEEDLKYDQTLRLELFTDFQEGKGKITLEEDRYWYKVTFVPTYEGWPVIRQEQLAVINQDSLQDKYAADYYYEELTVGVSSSKVVNFTQQSPTFR